MCVLMSLVYITGSLMYRSVIQSSTFSYPSHQALRWSGPVTDIIQSVQRNLASSHVPGVLRHLSSHCSWVSKSPDLMMIQCLGCSDEKALDYFTILSIACDPFQYPIRILIARSCKVSNPRDWSDFSHDSNHDIMNSLGKWIQNIELRYYFPWCQDTALYPVHFYRYHPSGGADKLLSSSNDLNTNTCHSILTHVRNTFYSFNNFNHSYHIEYMVKIESVLQNCVSSTGAFDSANFCTPYHANDIWCFVRFCTVDIDAARPMDKPSILNLLEWVGKDENIFTSIILFISFLNTELAHVAQLIVRRRQGPSYITWPVP